MVYLAEANNIFKLLNIRQGAAMSLPQLTPAMEDYLKGIFHLEDEGSGVSTAALATRLRVAAPSVTNMVKRLCEMGLVDHSPYHGIGLTPLGRTLAVEVVRHHRIIELYLAEFLDVPWDKVHAEAERLEHVLSEDLEERMAAKLGQPGFDPHGDPIPSHEGTFPTDFTLTLWDTPVGERAEIARVSDRDAGLLAFLAERALVPGTIVRVVERSPYGGTITLATDRDQHIVGADLARTVRVRPAPAAANVPRGRSR